MTAIKVKQQVQSARTDGKITIQEAKKIVAAAEKTPTGKADKVTTAEAKRVAEVFVRVMGPNHAPPGATFNPPPPGTPFNPDIAVGAKRVFNDFFIRHKLPYGENGANVKEKMNSILERNGLGEKMTKAPNTRDLHEVFIHDNRMVDGDRQDAFYDAAKNRFFVRAEGGGRANGQEQRWYGPFDMTEIRHPLNPMRPQ